MLPCPPIGFGIAHTLHCRQRARAGFLPAPLHVAVASACTVRVARAAKSGARRKDLTAEKVMSALGLVSRRSLKGFFRAGRITMDGEVVRQPKIDAPESAVFAIDGVEVDRDPPILLKFHKPYDVTLAAPVKTARSRGVEDKLANLVPGRVSPWDVETIEEARIARVARGDVVDRATIVEELTMNGLQPWIATDKYHPVGIFESKATGLQLFSRDGVLTGKLISPGRGIPLIYEAIVDGDALIEDSQGKSLQDKLAVGTLSAKEGLLPRAHLLSARHLSEEEAAIAVAKAAERQKRVRDGPKSCLRLQVPEGKAKLARRILSNLGFHVMELHRVAYGGIELGNLEVGGIARVSAEEEEWAMCVLEGKKRAQQASINA
eukprot:TRINITY_DN28953_c0_g1_i1.p1 TRINITY_DN28953_c0_g1~~TRINITY_DN28953_c0_g1_i1.p1  ORF type:complete len:391 (-),score=70.12 TRINITY_DN28953_c0_g1_i1:62-1192(-)